ncbi:MAG TPA: type II secretion system protein [Pseudobdellovibrionaceae bacterium]|nr:type II secretion system protein [Pseudobdellovibrionaceae bacterium]
MKNNRGFTLIESVIGIGLLAIVGLVTSAVMIQVGTSQSGLRRGIEENIDVSVAERVIVSDLRRIGPSYNHLQFLDARGKNFFDLDPEFISKGEGREVVLGPGGTGSIDFIQYDRTAGGSLVYDAAAAYAVGPAPADVNKAATLSFVSLNNHNWVKNQRPDLWREGQMLFLDTPARLRPLTAARTIDFNTPPKSPMFLGVVAGQDLKLPTGLKQILRTNHPTSKRSILDADAFLRNLPSVGGGLPLVRLSGVKWVRYGVERDPERKDSSRIVRYSSSGDRLGDPFVVATDVKSLRFFRKSVKDPLVYFQIERD